MRPEDAQELIGQRRIWMMELKSTGPTPITVTCTRVCGSITIDANDTRIDIDQAWCEFRNGMGRKDNIWFTPEKFKSFQVSEPKKP